MVTKNLIKIIKLVLKAGKATAAPPIGPRLSQCGINVSSFCKEYNLKTSNLGDQFIPVKVYIYDNKTYEFVLLTPPTSKLLLDLCQTNKGSSNSKNLKIKTLSIEELKNIAKIKSKELNTNDITNQLKIIAGTAKNMGIIII